MALYFCALTSTAFIPTRAVSSQGCRGCIYVSVRVRRFWEKQGSRRWRSETTTDSLHHFLPNVRFHDVKSTGFDAILQTCTLSMGRNIQQNIKQNVQQIYILLCGFQSTNSDRFSGDGYEDPPVPISNTVVKLINAESTWLETAWKDRKPLIA